MSINDLMYCMQHPVLAAEAQERGLRPDRDAAGRAALVRTGEVIKGPLRGS